METAELEAEVGYQSEFSTLGGELLIGLLLFVAGIAVIADVAKGNLSEWALSGAVIGLLLASFIEYRAIQLMFGCRQYWWRARSEAAEVDRTSLESEHPNKSRRRLSDS